MGRSNFFARAALAVAAVAVLAASPSLSTAQVSIGVNLGPAPACPYGYYDYSPYRCAPYGYYGPQWFNGGLFIGAGPWYRGRAGWYGPVNRRYDPRYGYRGGFPNRGERFGNHPNFSREFHGNDRRGGYGGRGGRR